jgi:thiol-disulfide isomerase/thioredoxin
LSRRAVATALVALLTLVASAACDTAKGTRERPVAGPHPSGSVAPCLPPAGAAVPAGSPAVSSGAGVPVPDLALACLGDGAEVRLAGLGRPAVINLWASWCTPCRTELPALDTFARRGTVLVLGVNTRDSRSAARSIVDYAGLTFPMLYDREGTLLRAVDKVNLPVTLFVTAAGTVAHVHNATALDTAGVERLAREHLGVS